MFVSFSDASFFRLGLFSPDSSEVGDPLAPTEDMELQPCAPNTEPHDIWIKFLQERIEVSKDKILQTFCQSCLEGGKILQPRPDRDVFRPATENSGYTGR